MDKELKKQRIRSLIEEGGYADIADVELQQSVRWWKWLAAAASLALIGHIVIDLMGKLTGTSI